MIKLGTNIGIDIKDTPEETKIYYKDEVVSGIKRVFFDLCAGIKNVKYCQLHRLSTDTDEVCEMKMNFAKELAEEGFNIEIVHHPSSNIMEFYKDGDKVKIEYKMKKRWRDEKDQAKQK